MGGGIIQLVAYGLEDMFLTKDPQITFFKMVYRRHTSFTKEQIPQYFTNKQPNFGKSINCTIAKNGDLIGNIILVVTLPNINLPTSSITKFAWVKKIGFALIKSISITINGYEIDKHYGDWLNIWAELTGSISGPHSKGYKEMIGDVNDLTDFSYSKNKYDLFIPLQFWFCKNPGLALPIVSLQYSDIKINVEFEEDFKCYNLSPTHYISCMDDIVCYRKNEYIEQNIDGEIRAGVFINYDINLKRLYYHKITENKLLSIPISQDFDVNNTTLVTQLLNSSQGKKYAIIGKTTNYSLFAQLNSYTTTVSSSTRLKNLNLLNAFLLIDYYYLDDEERFRFSRSKHDYIIEQLFYTPAIEIDDISRNVSVSLDNPCKYMIWTVQMKYIYNSQDYFNYSNSYQNKKFNDENYDVDIGAPIGDNLVLQSTILCNGNERLSFRDNKYFEYIQKFQNCKFSPQVGINMYSYSLYPFEPVQPSGTFNTSQIDNIEVKLKLDSIVNINNVALFKCYGVCVNILRIINGLGALMFVK
jgi:hypothetical protein